MLRYWEVPERDLNPPEEKRPVCECCGRLCGDWYAEIYYMGMRTLACEECANEEEALNEERDEDDRSSVDWTA